MNRAKIEELFTLYVESDATEQVMQIPEGGDKYIDDAIDDVTAKLKNIKYISDPRLDFLAAALANLKYRLAKGKDLNKASELYQNSLEICKDMLK